MRQQCRRLDPRCTYVQCQDNILLHFFAQLFRSAILKCRSRPFLPPSANARLSLPHPPQPPNQLSGRFADFIFFQPEVLAANSSLAPAIRQQAGMVSAGGEIVVVVLQASEALARALQAQDFLVGAGCGTTPEQSCLGHCAGTVTVRGIGDMEAS